jgi:hypothetical protein
MPSPKEQVGYRYIHIIELLMPITVIHLMKCLAQTQGPKVRVNAVLPGLLLTEWVSVLPWLYLGGNC